MTYKLVYSELLFINDYRRSFENNFIFFAKFYSIWKKLTEIDKETGYVALVLGSSKCEKKILFSLRQADPWRLIQSICAETNRR